MQLNLSTKELKDLMEMAALALSIADVDASGEDSKFENWRGLHNRIFELARNNEELTGIIESSETGGELAFTGDYLEKAYFTEKLSDFSEHIFWTDLVSRLADKAIEDHLGEKHFEGLTEEERRTLTEPLEKSFWQECSTYGIDRLGFILPPSDA